MVTVRQTFSDSQSWIDIHRDKFTEVEIKKFEQAIELARKYYGDKKFYPTDVDLLMHALNCANTVAELHLYADAVIASILYAIPKYSDKWEDEIAVFGNKVVELIDGIDRVTQIRKLSVFNAALPPDEKKEQIEVIRKMLLAMASDIRVVLIVLVGRGELMLNLKSCEDVELQKKIAQETVEIYSPLANRLGVWQIKWELEDLSFKYMHPEQYRKIANLLDETREERLEYIEEIKAFLSEQMEESGITDYQVSGRAKHIFSIWKKMKKKNYDFDDLYDIRAVRVLVPEVRDCYTVLGIVHTKYSPVPGEFDDYISNPKPNNYQSLHTCVIGPDNKVVEIQIRTFAMHDHAEYGVAAHWRYKEFGEKGAENNSEFAKKVAWLRQLLDWREELTEREDISNIFRNEIFTDTIYVMTPQGKVIGLPNGSTPIDFAYSLHSNLGDRCRGAKVDGQIVPLATALKNGQRVEILTIKEGGPSINWLHEGWVKSSKAISHIRKYIRTQHSDEFYQVGFEIFERELSKFPSSVRPEINEIVSRLGYDNDKNVCIDLGKGELQPSAIREAINKIIHKHDTSQELDSTQNLTQLLQTEAHLHQQEELSKDYKGIRGSAILVDGMSGIVTHVAKCCKPIPGDHIIGFITQGNGVAIHRNNCAGMKRQAKLYPRKVVTVAWAGDVKNTSFNVDIEVIAHDRTNLLRDLTDLFSLEKLNISGLRTVCKHNKAHMVFTITLKGTDFNFNILNERIYRIEGVQEVTRK